MSILTVPPQLAVLQKQISGIKHAWAEAPNGLNASDLPAFVNFANAGKPDYAQLGDGQYVMTRLYTMRLYVLTVGSGIAGEGERLVKPLIENTYNHFVPRPSLGGTVHLAYIIQDSGPSRLEFQMGGQLYIGVDFTIQVSEIVEYKFARGE